MLIALPSMNPQTRFLLVISIIAMVGIFILQAVWLSNYYQVANNRFSLLTEKALINAQEKEHNYRGDIIESKLTQVLSDTNRTLITSRYREHLQMFQYTITSRKDTSS